MNVSQDNIYFLSALAPARLNKIEDDIFWHKNEANKYILKHYHTEPPEDLENFIEDHVTQAERIIAKFIDDNHIDLFIVHNASHPTNFVYAIAVGRYFEKLRQKRQYLPRYLLWWHDSHFERERFFSSQPGDQIVSGLYSGALCPWHCLYQYGPSVPGAPGIPVSF